MGLDFQLRLVPILLVPSFSDSKKHVQKTNRSELKTIWESHLGNPLPNMELRKGHWENHGFLLETFPTNHGADCGNDFEEITRWEHVMHCFIHCANHHFHLPQLRGSPQLFDAQSPAAQIMRSFRGDCRWLAIVKITLFCFWSRNLSFVSYPMFFEHTVLKPAFLQTTQRCFYPLFLEASPLQSLPLTSSHPLSETLA